MSVGDSSHVFYLIVLLVLFFVFSLFMLVVSHFLMPKVVLEKYFKQPFFNSFELALFSGPPYSPIRTIILMVVTAFPSLGKKRGLTQLYLLVPYWYRLFSILIVLALLSSASLVVLVFCGSYFLNF